VGTNACFNPALVTAGTTYTTAYTLSGSVVGDTSATVTVSAPATYNGYSNLIAVNETENNNIRSPVAETQTVSGPRYYGIPSPSGVTNYGAVLTDSLSSTPGAPDVQTYTPPFNDPVSSLSVGQTSTANYIFAFGGTSAPSSQTWTYINDEDVTVPAGTFRAACHFRVVEVIGSRTSTLDSWLAAGGGIAVKVSGNGVIQVLTSASINGVPLR
jgi:hypothetical protein